jgi:hypothetical protein
LKIQVRWENRNMMSNGSICKVTVDGTDCSIYEPHPFGEQWYCHKTNGPGVRYEIGVCIQTGWIVWVNGPFPCGDWPDLRIARECLIWMLEDGECYVGDGGYYDGNNWSTTPTGENNYDQGMKHLARARHETVNSRFKNFGILHEVFRHELTLHGLIFQAISSIVQLQIQHENSVFQIDYNDRQ